MIVLLGNPPVYFRRLPAPPPGSTQYKPHRFNACVSSLDNSSSSYSQQFYPALAERLQLVDHASQGREITTAAFTIRTTPYKILTVERRHPVAQAPELIIWYVFDSAMMPVLGLAPKRAPHVRGEAIHLGIRSNVQLPNHLLFDNSTRYSEDKVREGEMRPEMNHELMVPSLVGSVRATSVKSVLCSISTFPLRVIMLVTDLRCLVPSTPASLVLVTENLDARGWRHCSCLN
jgi:hypothetical protein